MFDWYPTSEHEVESLPEAPPNAAVFFPILGKGQVVRVDSPDGTTMTLAGRLDGRWVKVSVPTSFPHPS